MPAGCRRMPKIARVRAKQKVSRHPTKFERQAKHPPAPGLFERHIERPVNRWDKGCIWIFRLSHANLPAENAWSVTRGQHVRLDTQAPIGQPLVPRNAASRLHLVLVPGCCRSSYPCLLGMRKHFPPRAARSFRSKQNDESNPRPVKRER